jgi:hypothetical protein
MLPNIGHQTVHVKIAGITRSSTLVVGVLNTMQVKFSLEKEAAFRGTIGSYGRVQTRVNWVL